MPAYDRDSVFAFQNSPVAAWIREMGSLRFVDVNEAALAQYGYTREEFLQLTSYDLLPPFERPRLLELVENQAHAPGTLHKSGVWTHTRKDGGEFQAEIYWVPMWFQGRAAVLVYGHDVTDLLRTTRELRETQERYSRFWDESPDAMFVNKDGKIAYINKAGIRMFRARSAEELLGRDALMLSQPEHAALVRDRVQRLIDGESVPPMERAMVRLDGTSVDVEVTASAFEDDGSPAIQVVLRDITGRKRDEAELRRLTAALLSAQEEERRRIARELHDDLTQRLAVLAIELDFAQAEAEGELEEKLAALQEQVVDLSQTIRAMSHRLHPSILAHAGLAAALTMHAEEFQRTSGIETRVTAEAIAEEVPIEIATTVYRIAQESLRNVARHSGATSVDVILRPENGGLVLLVMDDGRGFAGAANRLGLGMISMEERARLVDGTLSIRSEPGAGSTVKLAVPLQLNR